MLLDGGSWGNSSRINVVGIGPRSRAVGNLSPMVTLRYSATHKNPYNLLYKLDPIRAYDLRLVKRIEVASIKSEDSFNDAYVKLLKTDNKNGIKAQVEIHKDGASGPTASKIWVKQGDDLFVKSGGRETYRDGYIVQACRSGRVRPHLGRPSG